MITDFRGHAWFLSNFSPSPISARGIEYPTAEHYFQAHKTNELAERARIAAAPTPAQAKQVGRTVQLVPDWEIVKLAAMRDALELKFARGTELALFLAATGDHLLQEGNAWGDRYWGVVDGVGSNWLGHLLMARRAEIRAV